ncbi:uncharacterized protein LODBEIA_P13570 [Lodderomyces beijingensis]|uniref:Protein BCP1 n=1 Tax=Lodderomyces beijingensis TaxID=1775926 RepID=A0ABP0ZG36_9ASCO
MSKRQIESDSDIDVSSTDESDVELDQQKNGDEEGEGDAQMEDTVDVDFDFFDLNPEVDFHATKNFLRQLFGDDHAGFDISGLADLLLTKNSVGTSIKTDGKESDPFALLSVISLSDNLKNPAVKNLIEYVLKKTKSNLELNVTLKKLLSSSQQQQQQQQSTTTTTTKGKGRPARVGLIVSERLINMPVEVVPPMYKMLLDEMKNAENANERYEFDYFLVISKVYQLVDAVEKEDDDEKARSKKRKTPANEPRAIEMDYFHLEDQILELNAVSKGVFDYDNKDKQETDSRRVFTDYGIDPKLSIILLTKDNLAKAVLEMAEMFHV